MAATTTRHANFNCTIQELKRVREDVRKLKKELFQLHHTGIKTSSTKSRTATKRNFNCTIQELKPKTGTDVANASTRFQLHHTGIKTSRGLFPRLEEGKISIAPYRN